MAEPQPLRVERFVLETSSLVNIERSGRVGELPDPTGNSIIIPSRVARELRKGIGTVRRLPALRRARRLATWLEKVAEQSFATADESALYLRLLQTPGIDDGEAQAIAIAARRGALLVIDENRGRRVAEQLGVQCMTSVEFLEHLAGGVGRRHYSPELLERLLNFQQCVGCC